MYTHVTGTCSIFTKGMGGGAERARERERAPCALEKSARRDKKQVIGTGGGYLPPLPPPRSAEKAGRVVVSILYCLKQLPEPPATATQPKYRCSETPHMYCTVSDAVSIQYVNQATATHPKYRCSETPHTVSDKVRRKQLCKSCFHSLITILYFVVGRE